MSSVNAPRPALYLPEPHVVARWREIGAWSDLTLGQAFARGAAVYSDVVATFHSASHPASSTLGQMHRDVLRVASALQRIGVRSGDVVALQVPTWLESAWLVGATAVLGCVIVPLVHILGPADVSYVLRESRARLLVVPDHWRNIDYLDRLAKLDKPSTLEQTIIIGEPGGRGPTDVILWKDLLDRAGDLKPSVIHPDDLAVLLYTSGTTAAPKGVQHTSRTLLAEMHTMGAAREDPRMPSLAPWPAGHIAGLLAILHLCIDGAPTVFMDQWNADEAAMLIERHCLGHMSATPFHLISLLGAAEAAGRQLGSLRDCMVGAATVPPQLVARCDAVGMNTYRCYGSSEHPTVSVGRPSDPLELRMATDGRLTAGTEVRIVDDEGRDLPSGADGEVATRGPELFGGYQREDLNSQAFLPGGWFLTGDVGRLDLEGNLTITDRKKDIIIRGGENISSRAVEDVLLQYPAIADAAAVAMPDPALGERVCAFVVPRPELRDTLVIAALKDFFVRLGIAKQLTPERLILVDELPRTAAGKVKKHELRARIRAEGAPSR